MTPQQFAEQLRVALQENLKAVVLYGSAASGDFVEGVSHYNILVVVEDLGFPELNALMGPVVQWVQTGNGPPTLFTRAQLATSSDVFPLEFLDIQQSKQVLYGQNFLTDIQVDKANLRLEMERELKGKLLSLRQRYLLTGGDPRRVYELMVGSLSTILALCRGALRMHQPTVPYKKLEALVELSKYIQFDTKPFVQIDQLKQGTQPLDLATIPTLFAQYLSAVSEIVTAVDRAHHLTDKGA